MLGSPAGAEACDSAPFRLKRVGGREVTGLRWMAEQRRGAIAFSHGASSSPRKYDMLARQWCAAGFDVWAPMHVDSTEHPRNWEFAGLASWEARLEDMRALSDDIGEPLVAAGHSYGALTALVMGGAEGTAPEALSVPLRDQWTRCVVALSPPPPIKGLIEPEGYGGLAVPALIQTGDRDEMPGWPSTPEGWRLHLPAFERASSNGERYLLVLEGVDHYFGGAICEPDRETMPQYDELTIAAELSTLFLAAYFPQAHSGARARLHARLSSTGPVRLVNK
jgi:pimeloyl-ACP methyl ester carboxylesterase